MSWESIGSVDTGNMPQDEAWILFCLRMARSYVIFVCGEPPDGAELDIMWHEHELGRYPSLGVWHEYIDIDDYVYACEAAMDALNDAVIWSDLKDHFENHQEEDEDEEQDENEDYGEYEDYVYRDASDE